MSRAADYTIKGFLYQFHKTLLEILAANPDAIISVEGIVEDVEVLTPAGMTAIQCKYHEASTAFRTSDVFRPLLQMMHHFHSNPSARINYILFAHYPTVTGAPQPAIAKADLRAALNSKNKEHRKHTNTLRGKIDLDGFLARFAMELGPSYDELVRQARLALEKNGIPRGDIDTLAYPNAVHLIATLSVNHDPTQRTVTKQQFLDTLKAIRKTAITRWTMALRTRKQALAARRAQLKTHLDRNVRNRYLVVDSMSLEDYETEIVLFVSDFVGKYHFKLAHLCTPLLCLSTSIEDWRSIQYRLYSKGIVSTDGYIGDHFDESRFFREPLLSRGPGGAITREFSLRLIRWEDHAEVLNNRKCDDLFLIGEAECSSLDTKDVNVERLASSSLKEVKFVMGVSSVYE